MEYRPYTPSSVTAETVSNIKNCYGEIVKYYYKLPNLVKSMVIIGYMSRYTYLTKKLNN